MLRAGACILAVTGASALFGPGASAQSAGAGYAGTEGVAELARRCTDANAGIASACREMALGAMAVQQMAGLAAVLGSDSPGTSSTLGKRVAGLPRFGIAVSGSVVRAAMPAVGAGSFAGLSSAETAAIMGARATAVVGVVDGFQLMPTLGGLFAVDALASYSYLRLPTGAGFAGDGQAAGAGLRLGILRESFTLPGISVAAMQHWHTELQVGPADAGAGPHIATGLSVTSLRATAGKNWFVVGLMGGVGWDRYQGQTRLSPRGAEGQGQATGDISSERLLYFVNGWFNFVLTRLSLEIGRVQGVPDPFSGREGEYDPAGTTWFASTAFRVTL